jgi:hypothetical protein
MFLFSLYFLATFPYSSFTTFLYSFLPFYCILLSLLSEYLMLQRFLLSCRMIIWKKPTLISPSLEGTMDVGSLKNHPFFWALSYCTLSIERFLFYPDRRPLPTSELNRWARRLLKKYAATALYVYGFMNPSKNKTKFYYSYTFFK